MAGLQAKKEARTIRGEFRLRETQRGIKSMRSRRSRMLRSLPERREFVTIEGASAGGNRFAAASNSRSSTPVNAVELQRPDGRAPVGVRGSMRPPTSPKCIVQRSRRGWYRDAIWPVSGSMEWRYPFAHVTEHAGQGKIASISQPTMLLGDHVVNLMARRTMRSRESGNTHNARLPVHTTS